MDNDIQLSIVIPTYQRITDLVVCMRKLQSLVNMQKIYATKL